MQGNVVIFLVVAKLDGAYLTAATARRHRAVVSIGLGDSRAKAKRATEYLTYAVMCCWYPPNYNSGWTKVDIKVDIRENRLNIGNLECFAFSSSHTKQQAEMSALSFQATGT